MKICTKAVWGACVLLALLSAPVSAQDPTTQPPPPTQAPPPPAASNPDSRLDPLQPDFNLAALPTTLRVPVRRGAFRVTHRFSRPLGRGDFGDLLSDFFGFDSGAQIGLEFRYGLLPGTQIGVHRTSDRTIQIFGQHNLMQQSADGKPFGFDVLATFEGTNNLREQKSSAIGAVISRKVGKIGAVYAEPIFMANTSPFETGDNNTFMIGLGARARLRPTVYVVGEITPRVAGYTPGVEQMSFGLELRSGGHAFQINFSNGFGTTLGQLARGGISYDSWFIGFNIMRKFF
jgi:Membrane bound beta barrel domain (DUF5777)